MRSFPVGQDTVAIRFVPTAGSATVDKGAPETRFAAVIVPAGPCTP
jgi:hypothetical protein